MRNSIYVFLLLGCGPRGVQTADKGTTGDEVGDADTDADADADADSDADTDTGLNGGNCEAGPETTGPWQDHPITVAGATAQSTPYTNDAGVGALRALAVGSDHLVVDHPITGAIVTAVDFNGPATTASFWFEDAGGPMYAYDLDIGPDPDVLKAGDEVSFTATEVTDYYDLLEVTAATDFTIVSSGNPVHVKDGMTGAPLTWESDGMYVVEVWGGPLGDPTDCGASCYDLDYGADTITLRSNSAFLYPGDCVHWIGPVSSFSGALQLNSSDYDWVWVY